MKRTKLLELEAATRRAMLKSTVGGCAALTNTSLISTILNMSATGAAVGQTAGLSGYKALVCLFQFGGNDSYNMLSPATGLEDPAQGVAASGERLDYLTARGGLYSQNTAFLGLDAAPDQVVRDSVSGRDFMIHPAMTEVKALYDAGQLTFVNNIGSLVRPTTRADYNAQRELPLGLFSHSDLQQHWMTSQPETRSQVTGWAGRMADLITADSNTASNANISMNIALGNVNLLQTGGSVVPYVITDNGAQEVGWYGPTWTQASIFTTMTDDYLTRSYGNLLEKTFAQQNTTALNAAIDFNQATKSDAVKALVDPHFPPENTGSRLQRELRSVARSIAASGVLDLGTAPTTGQSRQCFFVSDNGYDNHDELINNQNNNLGDVSTALNNFQSCMNALGLQDDVTLFTASDFARTLNSNGKGSDHAWGGVSMVMGGSVRGGRMYGDYPATLQPGSELDLGRGRLLPTTSVDEMACELAMWFGLPNDNTMMTDVLPNIRNFVQPADVPLGMLV